MHESEGVDTNVGGHQRHQAAARVHHDQRGDREQHGDREGDPARTVKLLRRPQHRRPEASLKRDAEGNGRQSRRDRQVANVAAAERYGEDVIGPFDSPFKRNAGIAVLRGNLCPDGAIIKPSAATPALMQHRGRAVVFETPEDFRGRIDAPDLEVDESCVLVLKGAGPKGYPGMPEMGNMPLPRKVLERGVTDMVRVSDARMSGTAYGTAVLHTAPEAAAGGPLGLVRDGDWIALDVDSRMLTLEVDEPELAARAAAWTPPKPAHERGYAQLYIAHVTQADRGCDFDFLVGGSGAPVPRESH